MVKGYNEFLSSDGFDNLLDMLKGDGGSVIKIADILYLARISEDRCWLRKVADGDPVAEFKEPGELREALKKKNII